MYSTGPRRSAVGSLSSAAQIAAGQAGLDWTPELLHLNDWPCALAAGYLRWAGTPVPSLLTIHNLAYQGLFPHAMADALGVPEAARDALDFYGRLSFLQAGIVHADQVNTVSISYARQITGPEQGCGLDTLLARRAAAGRLSGIINGIDESWDPRHCAQLAQPFGAPGEMVGLLLRRCHQVLTGMCIARDRGLADVQRLRAYLADMVDAHQSCSVAALVGIELGSPDDLLPLLARMETAPMTIERIDPSSPLFRFVG